MKVVVFTLFRGNLHTYARVHASLDAVKGHDIILISPDQYEGPIQLEWKQARLNRTLKSIRGISELIQRYQFIQYLHAIEADVWIVHHLPALEIAVKAKVRGKIILNAHEFYPLELENPEWISSFGNERHRILKRCLPYCSAVISVSPEIVEKYQIDYQIPTYLVRNVKPRLNLLPSEVGDRIRIVFVSTWFSKRKLDEIFELGNLLGEGYEMHFYLQTDLQAIENLRIRFAAYTNTFFHNPVPSESVCQVINLYDVGLIYMYDEGFNNMYSLSNKYYQYIQARLMVVSTPLVSIQNDIEIHQHGVISKSKSIEDVVKCIQKLDNSLIFKYKLQSHTLSDLYCLEKEIQLYTQIIQTVAHAK